MKDITPIERSGMFNHHPEDLSLFQGMTGTGGTERQGDESSGYCSGRIRMIACPAIEPGLTEKEELSRYLERCTWHINVIRHGVSFQNIIPSADLRMEAGANVSSGNEWTNVPDGKDPSVTAVKSRSDTAVRPQIVPPGVAPDTHGDWKKNENGTWERTYPEGGEDWREYYDNGNRYRYRCGGTDGLKSKAMKNSPLKDHKKKYVELTIDKKPSGINVYGCTSVDQKKALENIIQKVPPAMRAHIKTIYLCPRLGQVWDNGKGKYVDNSLVGGISLENDAMLISSEFVRTGEGNEKTLKKIVYHEAGHNKDWSLSDDNNNRSQKAHPTLGHMHSGKYKLWGPGNFDSACPNNLTTGQRDSGCFKIYHVTPYAHVNAAEDFAETNAEVLFELSCKPNPDTWIRDENNFRGLIGLKKGDTLTLEFLNKYPLAKKKFIILALYKMVPAAYQAIADKILNNKE